MLAEVGDRRVASAATGAGLWRRRQRGFPAAGVGATTVSDRQEHHAVRPSQVVVIASPRAPVVARPRPACVHHAGRSRNRPDRAGAEARSAARQCRRRRGRASGCRRGGARPAPCRRTAASATVPQRVWNGCSYSVVAKTSVRPKTSPVMMPSLRSGMRAQQGAAALRRTGRRPHRQRRHVRGVGMGATIAHHVAKGLRVGLCDLTRGEMGSNGTPAEREQEAEAARVVLGAEWRVNLGLPDRHLRDVAEQVRPDRRAHPRLPSVGDRPAALGQSAPRPHRGVCAGDLGRVQQRPATV